MVFKKKKYKLLIVDDDELVLAIHQHLFRDKYVVEVANDGNEALQLLREKEFDLIITDINMPFLNGVELTKKIRQLINSNKKAAIIGVTAKETAYVLWPGFISGMNAIFTKPIELKKIQEIVDEILKGKQDFWERGQQELALGDKKLSPKTNRST